ncbi:uncharacterized protein LOC125670505 [Ostrea edulis]|uniref:uncharacterized protein LOC125670505 n=1 Tax=Ostrea edulis TaxID=37623 RepID=UPI0024AFC140|nr:uncharacterized protein LOC125670505 [Ostrea edulis]
MYVGSRSSEHARVVMFHSSVSRYEETKSVIYNISKNPEESPLRVVLSTVALGMRADLRHVKTAIHAGPPQNIEAYIQQIGRAGISGIQAEAVLYFNNSDLGHPSIKKTMKEYCRNSECRRKSLNMYFGCDNENCALSQCCDACHLDLKLQWTFDAILSSMQKAVLRDKLVQLLSDMNCVLEPFIVERIIFDAHLYNSPSLLVSEFGLQEVFSVRITSMLTSFL